MSEVYLSWRGAEGLQDAGAVDNWPAVAAWIGSLPKGQGRELKRLAAGKPAKAVALERELARTLPSALPSASEELRPSLEQLLYAVIARRPEQSTLSTEESDEEYEGRPTLHDWIVPAKSEWASWPQKRRQRLTLLLTLQGALDTDPEEDEERDATILVCLSLLPDYPAERSFTRLHGQ
jgi:hypothetical protein